jgi:Uma2 family endonuclease
LTRHRTHHGRHARIIAIANSDGLAFFKINAAEVFNKGGDKMLARLFAIADNINPCPQLIVEINSGHLFPLN